MAIKVQAETSVTGIGYWTSSVLNAGDILAAIADEFENDLVETPPRYLYEENVYKVTITVEKA